ncbi:chymotrypsin-2-like [Trichogramma pretiosum]|uniref:chymotrypsin-2-like n=1 Tax=Trichogramma pretiosum TaxID=7493 RepID=UPI0006C99410|nr:chymotrypsin-2-like [Trichogramma pretiosum]
MKIIIVLMMIAYGHCQDISLRILGGENAAPNQAPWMAALIRYDEDVFCGGALITPRHVLTAAHCVSPYTAEEISVLLGSPSLEEDDDPELLFRAKRLNYTSDHVNLEAPGMGMITLEKEVTLSKTIRTIPLAVTETPANVWATLTGYGYQQRQENGGSIAPYLQTLPVRTVERARCAQLLQGLAKIGPHSLCGYTSPTQGACSGDSGSPLVYQNRLIGIAESVHPNCAAGKPDVYMDVLYYRYFIKYYIGFKSP